MSEPLVIRDNKDGVAYLLLNRPEKLNALNVSLFEELRTHIRAIANDTDTVGCVVLRGAGKCFSAGHDLQDIEEGENLPEPNFQANTIREMAALPQLVISAVHSHCYTGALELALGADIILASENAKFADTHAKWGLSPIWGMSQRLPRRIGRAKAIEMMMTCRTYTGREAETMGLANFCFPKESFDDDVHEFCKTILDNSAYALRHNKALLDETESLSLNDGLDYEIENSKGAMPDAMDRISRFLKG